MASNISILLIDDDKISREYVKNIIERLNIKELFLADDGEIGLKIFKEKSPDIVITDIEMPNLNGIAMSHEIREFDKKTPIIILSGHEEEHTILDAINSGGINKYLVKPIKANKLLQVIKDIAKDLKPKENPKSILTQEEKDSLLDGL